MHLVERFIGYHSLHRITTNSARRDASTWVPEAFVWIFRRTVKRLMCQNWLVSCRSCKSHPSSARLDDPALCSLMGLGWWVSCLHHCILKFFACPVNSQPLSYLRCHSRSSSQHYCRPCRRRVRGFKTAIVWPNPCRYYNLASPPPLFSPKGTVVVKISGLYRSSNEITSGFSDMKSSLRPSPWIPDQLVWGSDWPHTGDGAQRLKNTNLSVKEPFRPIDNLKILQNLQNWWAVRRCGERC